MSLEEDIERLRELRQELVSLEVGEHRHPERARRRARFVFEDSPTCLNSGDVVRSLPCSDYALSNDVPEDARRKKVSCLHISLDAEGETPGFPYRRGTPGEIEATIADWLSAEIERLQLSQKKKAWRSAGDSSAQR